MNKILFVMATIFWLSETAFFGWNLVPESNAELACDIVVALLFVCALISGLGGKK